MSLSLLALDTSSEACSAALLHQNQLYEHFEIAPQRHNQLILPILQNLLDQAKISLQQLDGLAFGCGPGSFTGLRIAASVTQGIAVAYNLPVIPISTLRALALQAAKETQINQIISAIDAGQQEIYCGEYRYLEDKNIQVVRADHIYQPQALLLTGQQAMVGIGSGWDKYHVLLEQQISNRLQTWLPQRYPRAKEIVLLAQQDFLAGKTVSGEQALPVYLRDNIVKVR